MDAHLLTELALYSAGFLGLISVLRLLSERFSFPYTVLLVVVGFIAQFFSHQFGWHLPFLMSPDFVYFFLLPLLLFESAFHINFHQFRLHFKTISFISTFGLLLSIIVVGFGLIWALGLPPSVAFLFGALISATDPIAVLAIFKTLGAPKRLALLADGESMFNDATGVIAFRIVSALALVTGTGAGIGIESLVVVLENFLYIFFGSMILGAILGYLVSVLMAKINNDPLVEATVTAVLALGSFVIAEHFFHLSGVITTVMAAIMLGNFGYTRISRESSHFVDHLWEYIGFLALSAVFFFASYQLNFGVVQASLVYLPVVILVVLVARAVSVYVSFAITNRIPFFQTEPNVPLSWQHVINWGGLRGIIPLVLVYSLPESYEYKQLLVAYTLATFIFTLLINALTIRSLLVRLGLHVPRSEEEILRKENRVYELEQRHAILNALSQSEFDPISVRKANELLEKEEGEAISDLVGGASEKELYRGLRLQAIVIKRKAIQELFDTGHINERVYFEFERELDLQEDEIEHPDLVRGRSARSMIRFSQRGEQFRKRISSLVRIRNSQLLFTRYLVTLEEQAVKERCMLLKARIVANESILAYLDRVKKHFDGNVAALDAIDEVYDLSSTLKDESAYNYGKLRKEYPGIAERYQEELLRIAIEH